jgi:PAS domain S-box-containing protein
VTAPIRDISMRKETEKTKSLLNRKVQLAFSSAIAILFLVGAFSYRSMVLSNESDRRVEHTHEVLENLEGFRFAMAGIESSNRGFALTGDKSDLGSYRASILSAEQRGATLHNLTVDNPEQQRRLPVLEDLVAQKERFSEMVIALRQARGLEAAADAIRTGKGQRITDQFQAVVSQIEDEERRLLTQRSTRAECDLGRAKVILILGTMLALLIAAAAGWSVHRDASKRRAAEEALEASQTRFRGLGVKYRGLMEAAPDAMVVVNQRGEIVLLNVQAEKQFGYRRDELLGQEVKNIIPEGFAERLLADGTRTVADALAQQIGMGIELIALRKDGSEFPIELMLSPLESAEGILVTAAIRNISVRKEAERTLTALEHSNTELDDFAHIASHDLKEPLRGIHNHARFLLEDNEGKLDKDSVGRLHRLTYLSQRMETLVNDLLYFSRLGRQKLAVQATDLNAVVHDIETTLDVFLGERSASIAIPKKLPITVCDKIRVAELFRNLITNGIKYNDKAKKVIEIGHLSSHGTPNGERFSNVFYVKDNGRGISPEFYEDIFRLFKRLQSTQASEEGTGVGLTFVKKIVERHSGKIWLESDFGLGTTFYFTLERQSHDAESSSPLAA